MMAKGKLNTAPNIKDPDGFYAQLLAAHEGLEEEASIALNARLVLLLANHIGDEAILNEAIAAAGDVAAMQSATGHAESAVPESKSGKSRNQ